MQVQSSKTSGSRNHIFSSFLRLFVLSLLMAAFAFTSLHAQTVAYVTFPLVGEVSVIDTSTNTVTATITVGTSPQGVVLSPDGTRAFVLNSSDSTISVIDTANNTVTATILLGGGSSRGNPELLAITPDGKTLYSPDTFTNQVFVVSTQTNSVVAAIPASLPTSVAITPDGSRAYVNEAFGQVDVIDTATNTLTTSIAVSSFFPSGIATTPNGANVYALGGDNANFSVITTSNNTLAATVPFPGQPASGIAISPDGSKAYISNNTANSVAVVDTNTNTIEPGSISIPASPLFLAVTPDGASLYVTNSFSNQVSVVSTATNTVVATVPLVNKPSGIAITTLGPVISKCPTVITQPGTYRLANDLHCFNTDGIDIRADNVTLMLNGHTITQDSAHFGLVHQGVSAGVGLAAGSTNVHIFGPGTITGFNGGVDFEQVTNSMVKNVTSTRNFFGFVVNGGFSAGCAQSCPSTGNTFHGNTSTFNNQHGFTLNGGHNNIFNGNNASNNGARGILLFTATGNNVLGNTLNNNGETGIGITSGTGTGNNIHQNTAQNNGLVDLEDGNPNCDSNTWKQNIFGTANQTCIQ